MELAPGWFLSSKKQGHRVIAVDLPGMGRDKTPIAEVKMHTTVAKNMRVT